jgi:putative addiction module killer protein
MPQVIQTDAFRDWLAALRDRIAMARVLVRVERMAAGNLGDVKPVGSGVAEARIKYGPGYRIYFAAGATLIVLLLGGDKGTQAKDIKAAKTLWAAWKEENNA